MKNRIISLELTSHQAAFFYLGQVGFLIKYAGKYILIDPYLTDYVDRNCCTDNVKWVRRYPAPISPSDLSFVDYVFCTHAHFDHTDPWTLKGIADVNPKARFFGPEAVTSVLPEYGIPGEAIEMLRTDTCLQIDDFIRVTAVPAAHEELHPDGHGSFEEVGYLLRLGELSLYHAGDCCPYPGLEERLTDTDVLFLPINGRDYYRRYEKDIIGCFDSTEAITIAQRVGARLLIPMHFDLYDVNEVSPAYFVDCLTKLSPAQAFHIFRPGEAYIFSF